MAEIFRIVFVKEGILEEKGYDSWIKAQKRLIESFSTESVAIRAIAVKRVITPVLVKAIERGVVNSVAFISISMLEEAEAFQKNHPDIPVTLFVGRDFPRGRRIILYQGWLVQGILNEIQKCTGPGLNIEITPNPPRGLVVIDKEWILHNGGDSIITGALMRSF